MKFEIKGDYFHNSFYLPPTKGIDSSYILIKKINPSNIHEVLWQCPADSRHINPVIESAEEGFKVWKNVSVPERIKKIQEYLSKIDDRKNEIASAISYETGRPLWETLQEVKTTIRGSLHSLKNDEAYIQSQNIKNPVGDFEKKQYETYIHFKGLGPTLIITSFCSPFLMPNNHILSALLAGNSIILKSSEETCYTAQLIMECFHACEFPIGVINSIQGDHETGRRLLKEKSIKAVFFSGTNEVGHKVLEATVHDLHKMVALNLGSKNTTIIHNDINMDYAINDLLVSAFLSSGQNCRSTSLIAIHKDIHEEFIAKFHKLAKKIIIDDPINYDIEPFMGPLVNKQSVDNYILFIGMAKREGFEEIMRGKQIDKRNPGYYVTPSIHLTSGFDKKSHFLISEFLAPTSTFIPYKDIEEAIHIANSTEFGLVSSIYTNTQSIKEKCLDSLQSGLININLPTTTIEQSAPYQGIKNSGNNRASFSGTINSCIHPLSTLDNSNHQTKSKLVGIQE